MKLFSTIIIFLSSLLTGCTQPAKIPETNREGVSVFPVAESVPDFSISNHINTDKNIQNLSDLKGSLIIIDFFGTWCGPCIKALPHLETLQKAFPDRISILLVSNEKREKLQSFLEKRKPFLFPIIIDSGNVMTDFFAPPAYPHTVVLNQDLQIVAVSDGASITEEMIAEWLSGKISAVVSKPSGGIIKETNNMESSNQLVKLSQQFMYASKTGEDVELYINRVNEIPYDTLVMGLPTDEEKKAFWINLYNAFTHSALTKDPEKYEDRGRFFSSDQFGVAGHKISLDCMEHGILRRSKIKWSLGYFGKLFPGKFEKDLRVKELDYRIHFALNCGAKSCPPIAFYKPENVNPQLEQAAYSFLSSEAEYDAVSGTLLLPAIMSWFRRDFGGKKAMIRLLKEKKLLPEDAEPSISFKSYNWELYTDNFKIK